MCPLKTKCEGSGRHYVLAHRVIIVYIYILRCLMDFRFCRDMFGARYAACF